MEPWNFTAQYFAVSVYVLKCRGFMFPCCYCCVSLLLSRSRCVTIAKRSLWRLRDWIPPS